MKQLQSNLELSIGIDLSKYEFSNKVQHTKEYIPENNSLIKIAFPDYYPNKEIVNIIVTFFKKFKQPVELYPYNLNDFMNESKKNKFDLTLNLFNPINDDKFEYYLTYLNFFTEKDEDTFITLLNNYVDDQKKCDYFIKEFIYKNSYRISLGFLKHIFLKNKQLANYNLDGNDLFRFNI